MTKCAKDSCEPKAIDKNGKPLAGAAKASSTTTSAKPRHKRHHVGQEAATTSRAVTFVLCVTTGGQLA